MHMDSNSPLRICYLISTFHPFVGGGETHARLLCRELIRQGCRVFVLTRCTSPELKMEDTVDGIPVHRVPPCGSGRWHKYWMLFPVFARLVGMRQQYDVILVSGLRLLGAPAMVVARLFGKKCVLRGASCGELSGGFIWDSPHLKNQRTPGALYRLLIRIRNAFLLKADGFLGISEAIHNEYRQCGVPEDRIAVINNGTDTGKFQPVPVSERDALRTRLKIPNRRIFAYSGKLNRGKGLEFLLKVWKALVAEHKDIHLLLIGSGEGHFLSCEQALRDYVQANGLGETVTFTGFVDNVNEYLQCSDYFVFPSENESLSNALIEALACGLPCLVSNVGGIPDTVKDGFNGRLLPVGNEAAWISAATDLLKNDSLAQHWGNQGRLRVLEHNGIASVARRHIAFLQSLNR